MIVLEALILCNGSGWGIGAEVPARTRSANLVMAASALQHFPWEGCLRESRRINFVLMWRNPRLIPRPCRIERSRIAEG